MNVKNFIVIGLCLVSVGCTKPKETEKTLKRHGFIDVQVDGYAWFACGRDDVFSTAFKATSPDGFKVEGAVCSGLLKGNTIRLD